MPETQFHFRLGAEDTAAPPAANGGVSIEVPLIPNQHSLGHGLDATISGLTRFGLIPSELGVDFLLLGTAVMTADKHVSRERKAEDSWTRELAVSLPVSDPTRWTSVIPKIEQLLAFLTGDRWRLVFRPRPIAYVTLARPCTQSATRVDRISLLSGGLDSFIGAIDLMEAGHSVMFVSHSAVRTDSWRQRRLVKALIDHYGNRAFHLRGSILVRENQVNGSTGENTERSRSFLFLSLAILAASAVPQVENLVVPENGLISLNIPLEELRLGSLSTRTTHPFFLARVNELLESLGFSAKLSNPYQFLTKGDMVRNCRNIQILASELANTISCSSPNSARIRLGTEQCGYCMPCLIRRASLTNNIIPDPTAYGIPDLRAQMLRSDKKAGEHVRAFQAAILRLNDSSIRASLIVHESGPLDDYPEKYGDFADLYRRGLKEVAALLNGVITRPHA